MLNNTPICLPLQVYHSLMNGFMHSNRDMNFIFGESEDAQIQNIDEKVERIKKRIKAYGPWDVYSMNETGLYSSLASDSTNYKTSNWRTRKEYNTIDCCVHLERKWQRSIRAFNYGTYSKTSLLLRRNWRAIGFFYHSNSKAWMTGLIYKEFLKRFK